MSTARIQQDVVRGEKGKEKFNDDMHDEKEKEEQEQEEQEVSSNEAIGASINQNNQDIGETSHLISKEIPLLRSKQVPLSYYLKASAMSCGVLLFFTGFGVALAVYTDPDFARTLVSYLSLTSPIVLAGLGVFIGVLFGAASYGCHRFFAPKPSDKNVKEKKDVERADILEDTGFLQISPTPCRAKSNSSQM